MMMRYVCLVIFLSFFQFSFAKKKEITFKFEYKVDTLIMLSDSLLNSPTALGKIDANRNYKRILRSILNDSLSIIYNFNRLQNLSVVSAPNNEFRIYTWTMRLGRDEYNYFGFTQYQRVRKKSFISPKIIENYVYALENKSASIGDDELAELDSSNWWGCIYYNIIPSPKKSDKTFLLIGWDGFGYSSTKKIIETVKFSNKGVVTFGHKIIRYDLTHGTKSAPKYQTKSRIIFEYNGTVSITCNYNYNIEMIVFDHLAPSNPGLVGNYRFYTPDFTYDALSYEKKKWVYKKDIDVRNKEDVKAIKWKPKDAKDKDINEIIPIHK